jgi:uncharacterized repeat protein (TIGR01451 family)
VLIKGIGKHVRQFCLLGAGIWFGGTNPADAQELVSKQPLSYTARHTPLFFTTNSRSGRAASPFVAITPNARTFFSPNQIVFQTGEGSFELQFLGAGENTEVHGEERQATRINYLLGDRPEEWSTDLPTYGKLKYASIYPGIDLQFGFSEGHLKSEFVLAPGSDPKQIQFRYTGLGSPYLTGNGDLMLASENGEFREESPVAFQWKQAGRVAVGAKFALSPDGVVHFELASYDPALPLIIDPVVSYSSYLGGHGETCATAIATDASGNIYVTGWTDAIDFPTAGPLQGGRAGAVDAFIIKLNPAGDQLLYATYVGGSGDDRGFGIAVDSSGNAYVTGSTTSVDFPTRQAFQSRLGGGRDAFVLKLNSAGSGLVFSTYLGGTALEYGNGIALDSQANAYVIGDTTSSDFPVLGPFQTSNGGKQDAFVSKIGSSGALVYSTYLGGFADDHGAAIAVDSSGGAYITGGTFSVNFPTVNAIQKVSGGGQDAFVAKVNPAGNSLVYSTYLGGSGGALGTQESGSGIAVDAQGNAYVAGATSSWNFPAISALQATQSGITNAFISKINPLGTALMYSTYVGGLQLDFANAIAVDSAGNAYAAGYTASANFPVMNPVQGALGGGYDAFVIMLNAAGNALSFGTFFGGSGLDSANGIALDNSGNVYVTGQTASADFPVSGGVQRSMAGSMEAFVVKLNLNSAQQDFSLSVTPGSQPVTAGSSIAYTVTAAGTNGFSGTIGFSVSGLPSGVTASFAPPSVSGSGSSTLTISTTSGVSSGTSPLTVSASSPSVSHNASVSLVVNTAPLAPSPTSVSPNGGSGSKQTFVLTFSDSNGVADIVDAEMLINTAQAPGSACYLLYDPASNRIFLVDDSAGTYSSVVMGSAATLQNSQCIVDSASSSALKSGNTLTLTLALTFSNTFAGTKNLYVLSKSAALTSGWVQMGSWTIDASQASSASATFVKQDGTTQGSWRGIYGTDGYTVIGDQTLNPSYVTPSAAGQGTATWNPSTSDIRALQCGTNPASRVAATWYTSNSFSVDLNFTDSNAHQLAAYFLDWDTTARRERIDILDANGKVLNTQSLNGSFNGGVHLVWNIVGHVTMRVTVTAGANAVLSGLFFGAASVGSPGQPALSISETHSGSFVQGQQNAAYTVTVSNAAGAASTSGTVTVTETVPAGLTPASMSGTGWSCSSLTCTRSDSLGGGSSYPAIAVTVNVAASASSPQVNQIGVSGGGSAPATAIDSTAITSGTQSSSVATFVKIDTTTQGNWHGVYGADGYNVIGDWVSNPAYVTAAPAGQNPFTWAGSTSDVRGLQKGSNLSDRVAGGWYTGNSFTVDLPISDANTHQLALYFVDWDTTARRQTVDILDAGGNVLSSQSLTGSFNGGVYMVWNVAGHVKVRVTLTGGANAVMSGLFFGAAGTGNPSPSAASFAKSDTTTRGNWLSVYGADGYNVLGDQSSRPTYVTPVPAGQNPFTWVASTTDVRALEKPSNLSDRVAGGWYGNSFTVDLPITDATTHQVAVYCLDWDTTARRETVDILDADGNVLNSQSLASSFNGGVYLVWNVSGHVKLRVTLTGGANAVISGLFFR